MIDIGSISAVMSGLNAAGNMVQSFLKLKSEIEIQAKVIEFQSVINAAQMSTAKAQSEYFLMAEKVRELEEQLRTIKAWEAEKQRYELKAPHAGCMVYALKKSVSNGEIAHYICANCYQHGKRSILQDAKDKELWHTRFRSASPAKYAEEISP